MENQEEIKGELVQPEQPPKRTRKKQSLATKSSFVTGMTTKDLEASLKTQDEQRTVIKKFVQKHLTKDVDFGKIHINRKCANPFDCNNSYHYSKDQLFKPGQEKIFSLFGIDTELVADTDVIGMLTNMSNVIAWKCIMKRDGNVIGEGHGAATVGEGSNSKYPGKDINATIKIAAKRARIDACLSLGFSEFFGQDTKVGDDEAIVENYVDPNDPVSDEVKASLFKWLMHNGHKESKEQLEVLKINGITDPSKLTQKEALDLIDKLKSDTYNRPELTYSTPETPLEDDIVFQEAESNPEPELTKDDRESIIEMLDSLNLGTFGRNSLLNEVAAKISLAKFTDTDYKALGARINKFLSEDEEIPTHWLKDKAKAK